MAENVNVAQIFNVALVSSVFAVTATEIVEIVSALDNQATDTYSLVSYFLVIFPALWGIKIFVDDHKGFAKVKTGFDLFLTILFAITVYSLLVAAIAANPDWHLSARILLACFCVMTLWTLVSLVGRAIWPRGSKVDDDKRVLWLIVNALTAAMLALFLFEVVGFPFFAILMGAMFVADLWVSKTFHEVTSGADLPASAD